jgi:chromosome segregation ATPase
MSAKAMEDLTTTVPADDFHALEEKIYRTIEMLKEAREAKAAAERTAARLREQLDGRDEQTQALRAEVVALRREREEVRTRVEKMLKQIETLTQEESGG